jgi:uncharacterized protein YndB with AHSA1/START domain
MLQIIGFGLVVVLVLACAVAATKPNDFRVARTRTMNAPAERIFALINDFRNFGRWSPWEKLDPAMQRTLSGPPSGSGAVYEWSGNGKAGAGRMEITESIPSSRIQMTLDFIKPFKAHNVATYVIEQQGSSTTVTWTMSGPANFISKLMQVFVSMDTLVGKDFDEGLDNIKRLVEA